MAHGFGTLIGKRGGERLRYKGRGAVLRQAGFHREGEVRFVASP